MGPLGATTWSLAGRSVRYVPGRWKFSTRPKTRVSSFQEWQEAMCWVSRPARPCPLCDRIGPTHQAIGSEINQVNYYVD